MTQKSLVTAALVLVVGLASGPLRAQEAEPERHKIAVLDIQAGEGVDSNLTSALTELTMVKVQGLGFGECIGTSDIKALLNLEEQKQLLNCTDDAACMAEIGGALGVSRMMTGGVSRLGSKYFVTLKLFDVHKARVLSRVASQIEAEDDRLLAEFPNLVLQLFGPRAQAGEAGHDDGTTLSTAAPAALTVRTEPVGSEVTLSGEKVGTTPLELKNLKPGVYKIGVSHRDYKPYEAQITLVPGQQNLVSVELQLERDLAQRNYEILLEKNKKERTSQSLWGVLNSACGGVVLVGGVAMVVAGLAGRNAWIWGPGYVVGAAGLGWMATGILQLLNLPEPPEPPPEEGADKTGKD